MAQAGDVTLRCSENVSAAILQMQNFMDMGL